MTTKMINSSKSTKTEFLLNGLKENTWKYKTPTKHLYIFHANFTFS